MSPIIMEQYIERELLDFELTLDLLGFYHFRRNSNIYYQINGNEPVLWNPKLDLNQLYILFEKLFDDYEITVNIYGTLVEIHHKTEVIYLNDELTLNKNLYQGVLIVLKEHLKFKQ